MHVTRLAQLKDCESIASVWDCLSHGNPFRRTAWLLNWWRHFGHDRVLYVLQVTNDAGEIVGIAPWYLDTRASLGRTLHPLGGGSVCSEYLGILATPEYEQPVIAALSAWLTSAGQGEQQPCDGWDLMDLVAVDAADTCMTQFVSELAAAGCSIHSRPGMDCWRLELPSSWDEYVQQLSKKHRQRARRDVTRWLDSGRAQLRRVATRDELDRGMSILVDLHQRRRQSLGQPGCFADPAFSDFLYAAAEALLDDQILDLCWLEIDDHPVAVEFQLSSGDVTYAYQSGIHPDYLDQRPGHVIQIAILRELADRGRQRIDFLRGGETYKQFWRAEPHPCLEYRIAPDRAAPRLRHHVWVAGDTMRQWIKSGLHAAGLV